MPELALLLLKEDEIGGSVSPDAKLLFQQRVLDSMRSITRLLRETADERPFAESDPDFITAEKAVRFGHAVHPFPRSQDEFTDVDNRRFGPAYGNAFALRWWAVEPELLAQGAADGFDVAEAIASIALDSRLIEKAVGRPLIPLHPWQVARLSLRPDIPPEDTQLLRGVAYDKVREFDFLISAPLWCAVNGTAFSRRCRYESSTSLWGASWSTSGPQSG